MNKQEIQDAINWLLKENCGTSRFLTTVKNGWKIAIVFGWENCGKLDDADGDKYADGEYHIAGKVAIQPANAFMACDYDFDWVFPVNKQTGDCWDNSVLIFPDSNLDEIAKELTEHYNDILTLEIDEHGEY